MNKKIEILVITLFLIFVMICVIFLLNNKNKVTINFEVISNHLEIKISGNAKIEYRDDHDSFFNEGFTIAKIIDENLLDKIKKSSNWRNESDEYTSKIYRIKNEMNNTYNEISKINNYYWIYKNNYRDEENIKYIEQMENDNIETYSYLVGIYDIDNDILYYYHMDM